MNKEIYPLRSNRGLKILHKDGRVGRTYHHNRHINGKVLIYFEKNPGKNDYDKKPKLVPLEKIKVLGFID